VRTLLKPILKARRPSPALVIACVALFVSLGGVSYGVARGFIDSRELKDNTIRSRDVRNNTLRTFDIRNSSVQGRDVAFDALTGDDISEESLGTVPSAGTADTARTATTAGSVNGLVTIKPDFMTGGEVTTLVTHGPLKVTATCQPTSPDTVAARLRVETTEVGSWAGGKDTDEASFSPADGPVTVAEVTDDAAIPDDGFGDTTLVAGVGQTPEGMKGLSGVVGLHAEEAAPGICRVQGHIVLEG
jgi:hypothetical protein